MDSDETPEITTIEEARSEIERLQNLIIRILKSQITIMDREHRNE